MKKRYKIEKVKMPRTIQGFWRGYGWQIKDKQLKLILEVTTTKKLAKQFVENIEKIISKIWLIFKNRLTLSY